jgi:precorrin-6Y C5,15-methyltransferase (decarboxylating) CbiT subunit
MMSKSSWEYSAPGIPDDMFNRDKTPMTKEEVRVLTLAKLRVKPGGQILDVGAGTGSITVECARLLPGGQVWAVERDSLAVGLIRENCQKFGLENVRIIEGEAPDCLKGLPSLDGAVIGGSGGRLEEIVRKVKTFLKPGARLVINAILLESVTTALKVLKEEGFEGIDLILVSISRGRGLGAHTALAPLDPVFIIWGNCGE